MNIPIVIKTLQELSIWLECSKECQEEIMKLIKELKQPNLDDARLKQIKFFLSTKMLFHPKYLGDLYIPGFTGDGTAYAWSNYLSHVADLCQKNL